MQSHSCIRRLSLLLAIGLLIAGCASTSLKTEPIAKTENPAQLIASLDQDMAKARAEQVDLLSPDWFAQAQDSCAAAKRGLDQGDDLAGIWAHLSKGRAQLEQATQFAEQSRYHLGEVIESRHMAIQAGGPGYKKEFADLEGNFEDLTRAVEKNNFKYVQDHKEAANQGYRALELRAIKDAALDEVRRMLADLEDQKVQKIAPQSHAQARAKLDEADAFISGNRYASAEIASHAAAARFYVQRLKEIARISTQFRTMEPEKIALQVEAYLHPIAGRLNLPDQRNQNFEGQQAGILNGIAAQEGRIAAAAEEGKAQEARIAKLNSQINSLNRQLAEVEGRSYQVEADKERLAADRERLAAEKRFNELFNRVQGYFRENEAEVYKQAGSLVIRLKAIQFPVGQAVIVPENYDLLAKVQKAITTFGQPHIVVEGHTDSTGSVAKNEQLSQLRAESVRSYLVANGTLPADLIAAVGYGPNRPLAPNETAEGRAINRRIDVVIKPEMK
jgi:OOP family OmpA-OmpF porin